MRNGALDVYKFIGSWIIVWFHFYSGTQEHFIGGSNMVEFFMIASGVFLFMRWDKDKRLGKNGKQGGVTPIIL